MLQETTLNKSNRLLSINSIAKEFIRKRVQREQTKGSSLSDVAVIEYYFNLNLHTILVTLLKKFHRCHAEDFMFLPIN